MLALLGLLTGVVAIVLTVYAIWDVRKQVRDLIALERKRAFTRVRNDMVWLFIDPTPRAHTPEIAKGLEEFAVLSQILYPEHTPELTNNAVNNDSLMFASRLVENGYATWKPGWDMAKVKKALHDWQSSINADRVANIFGDKEREKFLT